MARLKEDETIIVVGDDCQADVRFAGVYRRDTRYLSLYRWRHEAMEVLAASPVENQLVEHYARVTRNRTQELDLRRELTALPDGLRDSWQVRNTTLEPQTFRLALEVEPDLLDLFARFAATDPPQREVTERRGPGELHLSGTAADGVELSVHIRVDDADEQLAWERTIGPGRTCTVVARLTLSAGDDPSQSTVLPSYADWRASFEDSLPARPDRRAAMVRAIDDLRMLLLSTPFGPYPAAGMPWFGNKFGRDALITAIMLLPWRPEIAASVLRLLAHYQGTKHEAFREEEPGKILHEIRAGELSRTGRIPFARYYGSVDATALFVMTLEAHADAVGDLSLATELRENLDRALDWLIARQEGGDDLIHFEASGSGLVVQSWKDSHDSMNHADGSPAQQPLAVAEVQGYSYSAFLGGARLLEQLGDPVRASDLRKRAAALAKSFHARYWLEDLGTYAMALDKAGKPLRVLSSDPGHLLWCGIVPEEVAPRLVATMLSPTLWSGWGLRTLGAEEVRYAPASYHNGSVWPHDTALFGLGLSRYGFTRELGIVANALFDLAAHMPHQRIPELISGHARETGLAPVQYGNASSPQAWAAAALPALARLAGLDALEGRQA
jgi:glycogen debranching enzyme